MMAQLIPFCASNWLMSYRARYLRRFDPPALPASSAGCFATIPAPPFCVVSDLINVFSVVTEACSVLYLHEGILAERVGGSWLGSHSRRIHIKRMHTHMIRIYTCIDKRRREDDSHKIRTKHYLHHESKTCPPRSPSNNELCKHNSGPGQSNGPTTCESSKSE